MTYAKGTSVPVERSKLELERIIKNAGADQLMMGHDGEKAVVFFTLTQRKVRLEVPMPAFDAFKKIDWRRDRADGPARKLHDQACRERWRQFILLTKAKLTAIELGHSTVEKEFMADLVLADGRTLHEMIAASEVLPPLLGPGPK